LEPLKGQYNMTYLKLIKGVVDNLGAKGIFTILDPHQDVFNRKFCGEGVPDWAVFNQAITPQFPFPFAAPYPVDSHGYPNLTDCYKINWAEYYFSAQVSEAFQNLYDDVNGIQKSFANFLKIVASQFNMTDSVLGYELMNEPWAGDIYRHPTLILPEEADRRNLEPMYRNLHAVIRQVDDNHILFFENTVNDIQGINGFSAGPGGKSYNNRQAYSYHVYCYPDDPEGNPRNIVECDAIDDFLYATDMDNLKRLGCGGMLTEFGAMANATVAIESLTAMTSIADANLQSWCYWQFKFFNDITTQGPGESFYIGDSLETTKVKALSRTYAQAVAGIPSEMFFDSTTSYFKLVFQQDTTIAAPTVIFLNQQFYYPNGFTVTITPSSAANWQQVEKNYIQVLSLPETTNRQTVQVVILAK